MVTHRNEKFFSKLEGKRKFESKLERKNCENKIFDNINFFQNKVSSSNNKTKLYQTNDFEVKKPWGLFKNFLKEKNYLVKILIIEPKEQISYQKHFFRDEHWVILQGKCEIKKNNKITNLKSNDYIFIQKKDEHSIKNTGKIPLKILEVQYGSRISENDIFRLNDPYNRT